MILEYFILLQNIQYIQYLLVCICYSIIYILYYFWCLQINFNKNTATCNISVIGTLDYEHRKYLNSIYVLKRSL